MARVAFHVIAASALYVVLAAGLAHRDKPEPRMFRFKGVKVPHQPPFHPNGMDGKLQVVSCPGGTANGEPVEAVLCRGSTVVMDVRYDNLDRTVVTCSSQSGLDRRLICHGRPQSLACTPGSSDAPCEFYDKHGKRRLLDVNGGYVHSSAVRAAQIPLFGLLAAEIAALLRLPLG